MTGKPPSHARRRRIFAAISVLIGIGLTGTLVFPPLWKFFTENSDGIDLLFLLIMVPLLSVPGLILVRYGSRLFKDDSEPGLRHVVGTLVFLISVVLIVRLCTVLETFFPQRLSNGMGMIGLALLIAFAYPLAISKLLPLVAMEKRKARTFVTRGFLIALAWLLWLGLTEVFKETGLRGRLMDSIDTPFVSQAAFFLPAVAAYSCYAIAHAIFVKASSR